MSSTLEWINSLNQPELDGVYQIMVETVGTEDNWQQDLYPSLSSLQVIPGHGVRDGTWWQEWARCEVVGPVTATAHPRWSPTVVQKRTTATPPSNTGVARDLKALLEQAKWNAVKECANTVSFYTN